ncbi:hypothetical protein [Actinomadura madurae]|uniref:hypothetical protein n=1 Tax=Actinomadura madurae TaxID=1993 RepID=UPI0020D2327E|nr:hypothetical protein [Actinomadura madurae]MCP9979784.1 hypothetical protein [Actinomadura madurae]
MDASSEPPLVGAMATRPPRFFCGRDCTASRPPSCPGQTITAFVTGASRPSPDAPPGREKDAAPYRAATATSIRAAVA